MIFKSQWFWIFSGVLILLYLTLKSLSAVCFPFFMGFVGAYALNGGVTRLAKYHVPRALGSIIMVLGVLVSFVILLMVFIPFVQNQLISLAVITPPLVESWMFELKTLVDTYSKQFGVQPPVEIKTHISQHVGEIFSWSVTVLKDLLSNSLVLANLLSLTILTPIIMFYLLKDFPLVIQSIYNAIPLTYRESVTAYAKRVDSTLSDYVRGQIKVCLILTLLYSISLGIIGINQGIFIGIIAGIISFIPYVGMLLGLLATLASGFAHFEGWNQIILVFIIFTIVGILEGNVLAPRFIGERVGLHPVWVIFALLAAGTWFGFFGILFALPMAAIVGVTVRILLEHYKSSSLYAKGAASS